MNKSTRRMKCKQPESPQHSENNGHNKEHKIPFPLLPRRRPIAGRAEPGYLDPDFGPLSFSAKSTAMVSPFLTS
jgi:hypothetical protein